MNFVRKIVNSDDLERIVSLPDDLKHQKVEILILPIERKAQKSDRVFNPGEFAGVLNINDVDMKIRALRDEWERF